MRLTIAVSCAIVLSACSRAELPAADYGAGTLPAAANGGTFKTIYAFQGGSDDGAVPNAALVYVNGELYGTTQHGGGKTRLGVGAVYELSTSGAEKMLYGFKGGSDGETPFSNLVSSGGELYGTTSGGGTQAPCGTVFAVDATHFQTVYRFKGNAMSGPDGCNPLAGLTVVNGTLYGTTYNGGTYGYGTVFSLGIKSGSERVIHNFDRVPTNHSDGGNPVGNLTPLRGVLYGSTAYGGDNPPCGIGCGTLFKIRESGAVYSVIHRFDGSDGDYPESNLTIAGGEVYGITAAGGASRHCPSSCEKGVVFGFTKDHIEHRLHLFSGGTDGDTPIGGLVELNGALYGTTVRGGGSGCTDRFNSGCGTVYSVKPDGSGYAVLYRFTGGADGANPAANLINVNGTLYGTASEGGDTINCKAGCGTVFAFTP
jgi:uncharacterized repeat protein (TIGR03803 family)